MDVSYESTTGRYYLRRTGGAKALEAARVRSETGLTTAAVAAESGGLAESD